jgi:hypothetical protein
MFVKNVTILHTVGHGGNVSVVSKGKNKMCWKKKQTKVLNV